MSTSPILTELKRDTPLCDANGCLNPDAVGWSRFPYIIDNMQGCFPRKKRWDYWCILGPKFLFSATLAHVDYLGLAGVYVLEYETGRTEDCGGGMLFGRQPKMPARIDQSLAYRARNAKVAFDVHPDHVAMRVWARRCAGKPLDANLVIQMPPGHESLNVTVPWDTRRFQFTSKQHCLPVDGTVRWGEEEWQFHAHDSWAVRDYGRGIWPYRTNWNWGAFKAQCDGHTLGVNLGGQWTDGTGATENGVIVDGKLHKIFADVKFLPDHSNYMKPWRIAGEEAGVDLTLTPFFDRASNMQLGILASVAHQCFGHFDGALRIGGREYRIERALGWAEEHCARW